MLSSMMWSDDINDAHVIEFLVANKAIKSRDIKLKDVPEALISRLIAAWDKVKAFKPAI